MIPHVFLWNSIFFGKEVWNQKYRQILRYKSSSEPPVQVWRSPWALLTPDEFQCTEGKCMFHNLVCSFCGVTSVTWITVYLYALDYIIWFWIKSPAFLACCVSGCPNEFLSFRVLSLGYEEPLERDDLFELNEGDSPYSVCPNFEKQWRKEVCPRINGSYNSDRR